MKAVKVSVDFSSGARAGGLDPRDPRTRCSPRWQYVPDDPDVEAGWEVRVIVDESVLADVDLTAPGVTLIDLDDEDQFAAAVEAEIDKVPERIAYKVEHEALLAESVRQRGIDLTKAVDAQGAPLQGDALMAWLHGKGAVGVSRRSSKANRKAKKADRVAQVRREVAGHLEAARHDPVAKAAGRTRHTPAPKGNGNPNIQTA